MKFCYLGSPNLSAHSDSILQNAPVCQVSSCRTVTIEFLFFLKGKLKLRDVKDLV
jgi:hypothetical protein